MRADRVLDALMPRLRQELLALLLLQPERRWFAGELARRLGVRATSLYRDLARLTSAGLLRRMPEGRQVYYQANSDSPLLRDLQAVLAKTAGLIDVLREVLEPVASRVSVAFVFGSIARGDEVATSDVDLLVVGDVGTSDLALALRDAESKLSRPVNVTVYGIEEFRRKARGDERYRFLEQVLAGPKLYVIGGADGLGELAGTRTDRPSADQPQRDR